MTRYQAKGLKVVLALLAVVQGVGVVPAMASTDDESSSTFSSPSSSACKRPTPRLVEPAAAANPAAYVMPRAGSDDAKVIQNFKLGSGRLGYMLVDMDSGQTIAAANPDHPFVPASTQKVLTAIAGLNILGPEYRFTTRVLFVPRDGDAPLVNGVLRGDLYLRGEGDPQLASSDVLELAEGLRRQGVRKLDGRFFYDDSFFQPRPTIESTQSASFVYNPGISPLSVDFNRILVRGGAPTPELPWMRRGLTQKDRSRPADQDTMDSGDGWETVPDKRQGLWLPISNPSQHAAQLFQEMASLQGLVLPDPVPGVAPRESRSVVTHQSKPITELVSANLEYSNNLMAELVGMSAAQHLAGDGLSGAQAANVLTQWYQRHLPQVSWGGFRWVNHSGLTAEARVTPRQMVSSLMWGEHYGCEQPRSFAALLPASGWSGTLNRRLKESNTALHVWAKTGTINFGSGLAGYLFTDRGRRLAFAIFNMEPDRRALLDSTSGKGKGSLEGEGAGWVSRAKRVEEALIRRWAANL